MNMDSLSVALDRIGRGLASICCAIMFMLLIADIVLRQLGITFLWPIEYSGFLMAFIVFLPLAGVTRRREHMAADFFLNGIGGRVESSSRRALIPLANLLFCCMLLYLAFETAQTSWTDCGSHIGVRSGPMEFVPSVHDVCAVSKAR